MIWKWVNCSMGKCTNVPINQFDNLKMNLFGYWLLATGYWLLATGYWLLATAHFPALFW